MAKVMDSDQRELRRLLMLRERFTEAPGGLWHRDRLLLLNTLLADALRDASGTGRLDPVGAALARHPE